MTAADTSWVSKHIEVAGCGLVADVRDGVGSPLLFLHGAGVSRVDARRLLEALDMDCPLIVPDSRGHGESVNGAYDLQSWQQLIDDASAWLDTLDVRDAVVAGMSMGAIVTPGVALARPDRVSSLVPIYPVLLGNDMPPHPHHWAALSVLLEMMAIADPDAMLAAVPEAERESTKERLALHRELDGVCSYFRGDRRAEALPYTTHDLAELTLPVTVVGGADPFHTAEVAQELAGIFSNATLVELAEVPPDTHEDAIVAALGDHLRRHGDG